MEVTELDRHSDEVRLKGSIASEKSSESSRRSKPSETHLKYFRPKQAESNRHSGEVQLNGNVASEKSSESGRRSKPSETHLK